MHVSSKDENKILAYPAAILLVLRKMLLITHRQAWCWQDEYTGLTIEDIRHLEIEAQRLLDMKMNNNHVDGNSSQQFKSESLRNNNDMHSQLKSNLNIKISKFPLQNA